MRVALRLLAAFALLLIPAQAQAAPGDLDPSFGHRGYAAVPELESSSVVTTLAGGRIVVGGSGARGRPRLVALDETSAIDKRFGRTGILNLAPPLAAENIEQVVVDDSGNLVVLTSFGASSHLTRLSPRGSVDEGFGDAGIVTVDGEVSGFALDPDQRLILSTPDAVLRLLPDGSPDGSWGTDGAVALERVQGAVPDREGRVLVADLPYSSLRYFRLDESGGWDTSFPLLFGGDRSGATRLAPDGDDGAWVITRSCYARGCYNGFVHVLSDGTYGDDFGRQFYPRGPLLTTGGGAVLTGGGLQFGAPRAPRSATISRGIPPSTMDSEFGLDGHAYLYPEGHPVFASAIAVDAADRTVLTTTPYGKLGKGVLVARLLAGGERENLDADALDDADDRCPAVPGKRRNRGCGVHGKRRVTFGIHIGLPHGRVIGVPVCRADVTVRILRLRSHGPAQTVIRKETDFEGIWQLDRRLEPGRFRAVVDRNLGHGTGVCRKAKSRVVTVHKPAHSGTDQINDESRRAG